MASPRKQIEEDLTIYQVSCQSS